MKHISMIGTGLIGGSIALSIKNHYKEEVHISGYDQHASQLHLAETLGVIDQQVATIEEVIAGADIIFICTPVQALCQLLEEVMLSDQLKHGAIITDVGSTKANVVHEAERFAKRSKGTFIGGHPMAGSHKSGVEAANDRLFENAYYVLTPTEETEQEKIAVLKEALRATKAKLVEMEPDEHDQIVAAISHFPHVIASALVEHVQQYDQHHPWYLKLAAGGFKDMTRIASSNPRMWRDITISNRSFILKQLRDWMRQMQEVEHLIDTAEPEEIEQFFIRAKRIRDGLPERKRGAIPAFYDLFVDVPDHPGVIGEITTLLGQENISITNIDILETREDIMGVLRLSFRHEEDVERAKKCIRQAQYAVYQRD